MRVPRGWRARAGRAWAPASPASTLSGAKLSFRSSVRKLERIARAARRIGRQHPDRRRAGPPCRSLFFRRTPTRNSILPASWRRRPCFPSRPAAGGARATAGLQLLARSRRIYMPVIPGFDDTPVLPSIATMRDIARLGAAFAETVIGETADVIGQTFGGWAAPWLALDHSDAVGLLMLECPAGFRPVGHPRRRATRNCGRSRCSPTRNAARRKPGRRRRSGGTGRCCTAIAGPRPAMTP